MKNKLTIIGYIGLKKAYLNIRKEEAINRYFIGHQYVDDDELRYLMESIEEIEFENEFYVYDAWK